MRTVYAGTSLRIWIRSAARPRITRNSIPQRTASRSAMAILDELLERAANDNVHETVMGMAHRGRLNVLANIVGKSMVQLFSEFEGDIDPTSIQGSGDVKYHLGASGVRRSAEGNEIVVSVAFNPSHLEAVD